jgi:hypothetical protein
MYFFDDDDADDTASKPSVSKYANTQRGPRVRAYGEGTVYEFQRKNKAGKVTWSGFRAKRSFKYGERSIRVQGQGATRQLALDSLERNIVRKRVALGELSQSHLKLDENDEIRTVDFVLDEWLTNRKTKIRYNSWKGYDAKARNYLRPAFGSTPVRLLTSDQLETYFENTLPFIKSTSTGRVLGETAIRQTYWTFNAALQYALKRGWIDRNPLIAVDPPARRVVSKDEAKELRKAANYTAQHTLSKLHGDEDEARWLLAFMGLRQSEVLGLRTSCLKRKRDGKPHHLVIDRQLLHESASHGCESFDAKTGKWACGHSANKCPQRLSEPRFVLTEDLKTADGDRALPLTDRMYKVLREHVIRQRELQKTKAFKPLPAKHFDDLMFTTKTGKPRRHQDDRLAWKALLKKFAPELEANIRLHHARHFAVTMLLQEKRPTTEIQNILGWSKRTVDAMLRTYGHADKTVLLTDSMDALDSAMYIRVSDDDDESAD